VGPCRTAALRAAERAGIDRRQAGMRARAVRQLHRARRRSARTILHAAGERRRGAPDHHRGGPWHGFEARPTSSRVHRRAGGPVRLLHERHADERQSAAGQDTTSHRGPGQAGARWQSVPMRGLHKNPPRGPSRVARVTDVNSQLPTSNSQAAQLEEIG